MDRAETHANKPKSGESNSSRRFGRLQFWLVVLIPFVGLLLAAGMYFFTLSPDGRTNKGNLLSPPLSLTVFESPDITLDQLDSRWGVVIVTAAGCDEACHNMLYLARQSHIALDRDATRVQRFLLTSEPEKLMTGTFTNFLENEHPGVQIVKGTIPLLSENHQKDHSKQQPRIFLIDPLGNVILWYGKKHDGKEILKDMEKLLKLSRIG